MLWCSIVYNRPIRYHLTVKTLWRILKFKSFIIHYYRKAFTSCTSDKLPPNKGLKLFKWIAKGNKQHLLTKNPFLVFLTQGEDWWWNWNSTMENLVLMKPFVYQGFGSCSNFTCRMFHKNIVKLSNKTWIIIILYRVLPKLSRVIFWWILSKRKCEFQHRLKNIFLKISNHVNWKPQCMSLVPQE